MSKRWTKTEEEFLINNYSSSGAKYCADKLSRSESSVKFKVKSLNLSYDKFRSWTNLEIEFLKNNYSKLGPKKCAEILGKKEIATQDKGKSLGLSLKIDLWNEDETLFLIDNYSKFTLKELSKMMQRSCGSIKKKANRLNLTNKDWSWSKNDVEFLIDNYKIHGSSYCSKKLNRTKSSIIQKYKSLKHGAKEKIIWRRILRNAIERLNCDKNNSTHNHLGYTAEQLSQRLEVNFLSGMSWDNYGEWHIDHKKPISKFDKDTPVRIVNALCNLQPMWAKDNLSKGNNF